MSKLLKQAISCRPLESTSLGVAIVGILFIQFK